MGYISAKKFPLDKTWSYLFPSKVFIWPSIVSWSHIPYNRFFYNILSAWYLCDNEITANRISCCVFLLSVSFVYSIPIIHCYLISYEDTDEWPPLDWNAFACSISCNSIPNWGTFLGIYPTFTLAINLCNRVPMSYRYWLSILLSYFPQNQNVLLDYYQPWLSLKYYPSQCVMILGIEHSVDHIHVLTIGVSVVNSG